MTAFTCPVCDVVWARFQERSVKGRTVRGKRVWQTPERVCPDHWSEPHPTQRRPRVFSAAPTPIVVQARGRGGDRA